MPTETEEQKAGTAEEQLLRQIREDFAYCKAYWRENYEEAEKDMDCMACEPPADFKKDRENRPCVWPDEVSQYVKQANNNLRQNKRSIKLSPKSEDATDQDAEHRQAYIRGIEDASKAQSIYCTAFEACVACAFGFWRIKTVITGKRGEQEPRLSRIPNQFTVYADPDAREADFSDSSIYFVIDSMREKTFANKYKKAKKRSFTGADREAAPDFFNGGNVVVAEYWTREESEDEDGETHYKVTQRITNGVEILETNEWIGSAIPIIGVFGEELFTKQSGESKRRFMSLIRRARGAQQMMAYFASQEAEEFGLAPRAPLQGFKGQFDSDVHKTIHKIPQAYVEFGIPEDWQPNWGAPPLPTRVPFVPNAQAYEISIERWRRQVQAAVGASPLPTDAQRINEKSGVALEKIQNQTAVGSFHFTDNFVRALGNTGRQLNELITKLAELDSLPKRLLGKDQKGEDMVLMVTKQQSQEAQPLAADSQHLPEANQFFAHRGQFEVTITDGPNYLSQREEASATADLLLQVVPKMGLPPQLSQEILAIAIKLKNLGALGEELSDILSPPDPNKMPPQVKAILAQSQGQIQMLTQELQKLQMEKLGKVVETQGKAQIAQMDNETKLAVAEITTNAQSINERLDLVMDMLTKLQIAHHDAAHDVALQSQQQQHEREMAAQQHEQAMEQGEQAGAQALTQQAMSQQAQPAQ